MHIFLRRIPDSIGRDIEKKCQSIFPLHDVFIRKVKTLKKPKFDGELNALLPFWLINYYFPCSEQIDGAPRRRSSDRYKG